MEGIKLAVERLQLSGAWRGVVVLALLLAGLAGSEMAIGEAAAANDGSVKWDCAVAGQVNSSPAIGSDGTIYAGTNDGYLYAIKPDGTVKWRSTVSSTGQVNSSPAIGSDGTVYVGSSDGKLYAIKPDDGTAKWASPFAAGGAITSSPAIGSDGTIYVGASDGKLYAINPDNGATKWNSPFSAGGAISSSPAIGSDGTIYVGAQNGTLYAIGDNGVDTTPSQIKFWSLGGPVNSSPAIYFDGSKDIIYVGSEDLNISSYGHFYAYTLNNNEFLWSEMTRQELYMNPVDSSSPAIGSDGTIYVGAKNGDSGRASFYAFHPDGTLSWSNNSAGNSIQSSPAIGSIGLNNNPSTVIYVGSSDETLHAINADGTQKWQSQALRGQILSSPAIGPDGTVYIGTQDDSDPHAGHLYAFNTDCSRLADSPWPQFRRNPWHTANSTDFTLTAAATDGGTASPATAVVHKNGSVRFDFTPDDGHALSNVVNLDGSSVSLGGLTSYTFSAVTANHHLAATFIAFYTITASAGTGGSISPAGATTIQSGNSQAYTITPADGYRILDVKLDGASLGAVTSYTVPSVSANHTITATFQKTWQLTASAGTGGTITPAGTSTVDDGSSKTITITPNTGYAVLAVTVNGVLQGAVTTLHLTVTADTTVQAVFAALSAPSSNSGSGAASVTSSTTTTQAGEGVVLTPTTVAGATAYVWDFGNGQTQTTAAATPISYDYPVAGAYTVTFTAQNASGTTLGTATTPLTVNFGQIEASPAQATGNSVVRGSETFLAITGPQLQSQYGVTDTSMQPLSQASTFTATLSESLKPTVFQISFYDVPVPVNTLRLVKLKGDGTNKEYTYGSSASIDKDGYWWITDAQGFDIPINATLAAKTLYYANFVIQDNGPFDADPTPGHITDPVTIAKSDIPVTAGSSGGGGCVYSPAGDAGLGLVALLLGGAGRLLLTRRRRQR